MSALAVKLPKGELSTSIALVAHFCGEGESLQLIPDANVEEPQLRTKPFGKDYTTIAGHNTICRFIASNSKSKAQLLGRNAEDGAMIAEWISYRNTDLVPLMDDKLIKINEHLKSRVFMVGNEVTLADLVLLGAVSPAVAFFPVAQVGAFTNLIRWYDFLSHTADTGHLLPPVKVQRPAFRLPPPPPPAAPKAAGKDPKASVVAPAKAAKAAVAAVPASPPAPSTPAAALGASAAKSPIAHPVVLSPVKAASQTAAAAQPAGSPAEAAAGGDAPQPKKEKKAKKEKAPAAPKAAEAEPTVDVLNIRVGRILSVELHPNADGLYVEQIDLGEGTPRQIVSGLVKFVPKAEMEGRLVLVVTNLKPAKMREVMSYGMVLCASDAAHENVEPVKVPEGVELGEKVTFEGFTGEPEEQLNPKKKIFERIAPDLQTDAAGVANYKGVPFMTSKGPITSVLVNSHVK